MGSQRSGQVWIGVLVGLAFATSCSRQSHCAGGHVCQMSTRTCVVRQP